MRHSFTAAVVAVLFSVAAEPLGAQLLIRGEGAPGRYHPLYTADSTWAALDTETLVGLNAQVVIDKEDPVDVAEAFLADNGLT